ncbi:hypothetical protein DUI87_05778 [Hirundo rustica rustica]|uniref:Uncharacterized protein n=1 Tax=Hirundo rustica rustica TaxID=333673 RepID=A0A3M0KWY5_HIRRU|nr:hypothetical protein DUI87_05778 [Hirundo rustica rustica]
MSSGELSQFVGNTKIRGGVNTVERSHVIQRLESYSWDYTGFRMSSLSQETVYCQEQGGGYDHIIGEKTSKSPQTEKVIFFSKIPISQLLLTDLMAVSTGNDTKPGLQLLQRARTMKSEHCFHSSVSEGQTFRIVSYKISSNCQPVDKDRNYTLIFQVNNFLISSIQVCIFFLPNCLMNIKEQASCLCPDS